MRGHQEGPGEGGRSSRAQVLRAVAQRLFQTHDDGHLQEQVHHAAAEMALQGPRGGGQVQEAGLWDGEAWEGGREGVEGRNGNVSRMD